ncbi:MAG: sulfotransferase domain-containing protein [Acidobacteriota bacterium]
MKHETSRLDISGRLKRAHARMDNLLFQSGIRNTRKLPLPDFLGIGIDKAGTTWLYEVLDKHPEVFVSHQKELNYFDRDIATKSLGLYSDNFKDGANKVKGEITPGYAYIPLDRIRFIHVIMPNVRLILLMRNPIEQQWSFAFHQLVHIAGADITDESKFLDFFRKNAFYKSGGYTGIITKWLSVFPAEQLYVGFYYDINDQPKKLLCQVFNHIGVSCEVDWGSLPYNQVIVPPAGPEYEGLDQGRGVIAPRHRNSVSFMPDRYRLFLRELYHDEIRALHDRFGDKVARWVW